MNVVGKKQHNQMLYTEIWLLWLRNSKHFCGYQNHGSYSYKD